MLRWLLVLICMVAAPEAAADEFTLGQQHYRAGIYGKAYELWLPGARGGDVRAQYSIGVLYERGQSVQKDIVSAAKWYALAASQGYEPAVTALRSLAPELRAMLEEKRRIEGGGTKDKPMGPPTPKQKPASAAQAGIDDIAELLAQLDRTATN